MKHTPLALFALLLLFAACAQQSAAPTTNNPTAEPTAESAPTRQAAATTSATRPTAPATATPPATTTPNTAVSPTPLPWLADIDGALIGVTLDSQVGVLLDDYPAAMRDRVAAALLAQPADTWQARAVRQARLTHLRLNFRDFAAAGKGQLPLPPHSAWRVTLDPAGPVRQTVQEHDLVLLNYTLETTILTDAASAAASEPALAEVGGVWQEPFLLPLDPDYLVQRTANACINEAGFPPNSYDSENVWHFYDFTCTADSGGAAGCHRTQLASFDCQDALALRIGTLETAVRFERLPWDAALADAVRLGPLGGPNTPDLLVVGHELEINRIVYRYIAPDDCALEENTVGGSGWRRLLQFNATVQNTGGVPLHVGPVVAEDLENHVFEYNLCHDHFHYSNYGIFFLEGFDVVNSKQAFCVQSTSRFGNHEASPLTHGYSCSFQGIQAGWVDEYVAGLDGQWVDITDLQVPADGRTVQLGFAANGDRFLCEGTPALDADGEPLWEPSGELTPEGESINRPVCEFDAGWDANNEATREVFVPQTGSFVTAACAQGEHGPLRNCGFTELELADVPPLCTSGAAVSLTLAAPADAAPQRLRVCERSAALGVGVACAHEAAVASFVVEAGETAVSFTCTAMRDAPDEGGYALYQAPIWPEDALAALTAVNSEP
ncbi:MAG: hypothetical protein KC425_26655 [Anaerolineales bacterium]|nr:hypothetical protein [Anaerolineales bacterium]